MKLFDFGKKEEKKDEVQENLRILATNIETINQRLDSGNSKEGNMEEKVEYLVNTVYYISQMLEEKINNLEDLSQKVEHLISHVYEYMDQEKKDGKLKTHTSSVKKEEKKDSMELPKF